MASGCGHPPRGQGWGGAALDGPRAVPCGACGAGEPRGASLREPPTPNWTPGTAARAQGCRRRNGRPGGHLSISLPLLRPSAMQLI